MGNVWGKSGSKGKKSGKVANTTHESDKGSLIPSDRSNREETKKISKSLTVILLPLKFTKINNYRRWW